MGRRLVNCACIPLAWIMFLAPFYLSWQARRLLPSLSSTGRSLSSLDQGVKPRELTQRVPRQLCQPIKHPSAFPTGIFAARLRIRTSETPLPSRAGFAAVWRPGLDIRRLSSPFARSRSSGLRLAFFFSHIPVRLGRSNYATLGRATKSGLIVATPVCS